MTDLENAIYAAAFVAYLNDPKPDTPTPSVATSAAAAAHTAVDLYRWSGADPEVPVDVTIEEACYSASGVEISCSGGLWLHLPETNIRRSTIQPPLPHHLLRPFPVESTYCGERCTFSRLTKATT